MGKLVELLYAQPAAGIELHLLALNKGGVTQEITNKQKTDELFTAYLAASVPQNAQGQVIGVMGKPFFFVLPTARVMSPLHVVDFPPE
jgi:hypothetical protein